MLGAGQVDAAILFFDEADALFASRVSKVESANDASSTWRRTSSQQLERYEGLVILATNLETTIDYVFKRRIALPCGHPFP